MIGFHLFKDFKIQCSAVSLGSILNYLGLEVTQITDTQGDWSELATQPQSNGKGSWDI